MVGAFRILLVEDNPESREPLCAILELEGYRVSCVGTVAAAGLVLGSEAFDAVIVDLGLPDGDGTDVLKTAHAQPDPPAAIVFTGLHRLRDVAEQAGCDAFVVKPEIDDLLAQLRSLVSSRRLQLATRLQRKATKP